LRALGRDLRLGVVGQAAELGQAVDDPLLGLVVAEVVGELHLHVRQAEQRDGADAADVRNPGELDLDRDGDVALHLLGRLTGILGDDLHQRRHRVGIGLDVELEERRHTYGEQHGHGHEHQPAVAQRKGDESSHRSGPSAQSALAARSMKMAPDETTLSWG
jgi:hypothetical protein